MSKQDIISHIFSQPTHAFERHLDLPGNHRIIFSGRFGTGKTTFLRDWFFSTDREGSITERYNVFHIFPVNYSVAQNEDIFTYIKYDILSEMILKGMSVEESLLTSADFASSYMLSHPLKVLRPLLKMLPMVGKDIDELIETSENFRNELDAYALKTTESMDAGRAFDKLMTGVEEREGNIYEANLVTKLIKKELEKVKQGNKGQKENILIIDDLDRIDPEHIFRVLNIFAAHFDNHRDTSPNKFGFDKIILVCDIYNIRQIFKAKFGVKVDFNGYIDKFYSHRVFDFNMREELLSTALGFVFDKMIVERSHGTTLRAAMRQDTIIHVFLVHMVDNGQLQLRNLVKLPGILAEINNSYGISGLLVDRPEVVQFINGLRVLTHMTGDPSSLRDCVEHSHQWERWVKDQTTTKHLKILVYILSITEHRCVPKNQECSVNGKKYLMSFENNGSFDVRTPNVPQPGLIIPETETADLKELFILAIDLLAKQGIL